MSFVVQGFYLFSFSVCGTGSTDAGISGYVTSCRFVFESWISNRTDVAVIHMVLRFFPHSRYDKRHSGLVTSHTSLQIRSTCTTNNISSPWFVMIPNLHDKVYVISSCKIRRYFDSMLYLTWANVESTNVINWIVRM